MANITIWNKGKRTWKVKDADGKNVELAPQESVNMDEVAGLKLVAAYPRDLTTSGIAAPSFDDIKRREQSVNDREAHLDKREKELDEREKAIKAREDAQAGVSEGAETPADEPAKKRGRPAAPRAE